MGISSIEVSSKSYSIQLWSELHVFLKQQTWRAIQADLDEQDQGETLRVRDGVRWVRPALRPAHELFELCGKVDAFSARPSRPSADFGALAGKIGVWVLSAKCAKWMIDSDRHRLTEGMDNMCISWIWRMIRYRFPYHTRNHKLYLWIMQTSLRDPAPFFLNGAEQHDFWLFVDPVWNRACRHRRMKSFLKSCAILRFKDVF